MVIIREISDEIAEELHDAKEYALKANHFKGHNKELAEMYMDLSEAEMGHVDKLHGAAEKLIAEYREKNGAPPAAMAAVYEYLHKKELEKASEIKSMQSLYHK